MDDIVPRLRNVVIERKHDDYTDYLLVAAADEIERLHTEIKRLHSVVVLCPRCQETDNG